MYSRFDTEVKRRPILEKTDDPIYLYTNLVYIL